MSRSMTPCLLWATLAIGITGTPALADKPSTREGKAKSDTPADQPGTATPKKKDHRSAGPGKHRGGKPGKHRAAKPGKHRAAKPGKHRAAKPGQHRAAKPGKRAQHRPGARPHAQKPHTRDAADRPRAAGAPMQNHRPASASAPRARPDRTPGTRPSAGPGVHSPGRPGAHRGASTGGVLRDKQPPSRRVRIETSTLLPDGWTPKAHRYHLQSGDGWSPENLTAGIFSYNAPPKRHQVTVVEKNPLTGTASRCDTPLRAVNRAGSFALGMKGGVLADTDQNPSSLSADTGYGIVARYRPLEAVGIEGSWMRHVGSGDDPRVRSPLSVSAQLFAFPWTRLSPFVSAGATFGGVEAEAQGSGARAQPHAGLGLELAIGKRIAFDVEARYLSQLRSLEAAPGAGGAAQVTGGLLVHF